METRHDPARAFLESVREARFNEARCMEKIALAEARCTQVTAQMSRAPGGHGDVHKDGPRAALSDLRSLLGQLYREAVKQELAVEQFVASLDNDLHRIILRLKYIDLLHWPQVQAKMEERGIYYTERHILRLHGDALQAARAKWAELHPDETKGDSE